MLDMMNATLNTLPSRDNDSDAFPAICTYYAMTPGLRSEL